MKKKVYCIIAAVLVLAVAGLVVFAQMKDRYISPEDLASGNITEDMLPEYTLDDTPDLPDPAENQIGVDPDFRYVEPDERFFKTLCYKEDIFPSERKYELITMENGDAIMLDVILDENRIKAVNAYPIVIHCLSAGPLPQKNPFSVMDYYRALKEKNIKMYLYRLTYLKNTTGEEKDIAYLCGAILGKPEDKFKKRRPEEVEKRKDYSEENGWFYKLMIYDAFVKDDLSELKLLAGQNTDLEVMVFRLSDILQKSDEDECFALERSKDFYETEAAGGHGINEFRFLTPSVVSITKRSKGAFQDVTYKYHLMPVIMRSKPNLPEMLYLKIKWFNEACDYYTFSCIGHIYGFRKAGLDQDFPHDSEIAAYRQKHGFTDSSEPSYDMNEWYGWTRMNRDTSWLKD